MEIKQGFVYHIKESYFKFVKDDKLMKNHEGNSTRPNYFCLQMNDDKVIIFRLKENGINLIFPDIDTIKAILLEDLVEE